MATALAALVSCHAPTSFSTHANRIGQCSYRIRQLPTSRLVAGVHAGELAPLAPPHAVAFAPTCDHPIETCATLGASHVTFSLLTYGCWPAYLCGYQRPCLSYR